MTSKHKRKLRIRGWAGAASLEELEYIKGWLARKLGDNVTIEDAVRYAMGT